jgi:hypothetical protein
VHSRAYGFLLFRKTVFLSELAPGFNFPPTSGFDSVRVDVRLPAHLPPKEVTGLHDCYLSNDTDNSVSCSGLNNLGSKRRRTSCAIITGGSQCSIRFSLLLSLVERSLEGDCQRT